MLVVCWIPLVGFIASVGLWLMPSTTMGATFNIDTGPPELLRQY
jgi:hypothetical protein